MHRIRAGKAAMRQHETTVVWKAGKEGRLHAGSNPEIRIATRPEFGGPQNIWSPEDLLAGASCESLGSDPGLHCGLSCPVVVV